MLLMRVRRRSSRLMRSRPLVVRSRMRWAAGKSNTVRLSATAVSAHSASFGCCLRQDLKAKRARTFGLCLMRRVEDGPQLSGDGLFGFLPGDESAGVLLQMELAALPRHGWQHGPAGGFQADMIVRDD